MRNVLCCTDFVPMVVHSVCQTRTWKQQVWRMYCHNITRLVTRATVSLTYFTVCYHPRGTVWIKCKIKER